LDKDVIKKIIGIELNKLVVRLKDKNFKISFDKTIIERISELNTQEDYGARPIKRIIQNLCEDFLSDSILKGDIKENETITLKFKDGEIKIFKKKV
jgi:ATP-dependent Clp protease ATP-binding subunit ClpC